MLEMEGVKQAIFGKCDLDSMTRLVPSKVTFTKCAPRKRKKEKKNMEINYIHLYYVSLVNCILLCMHDYTILVFCYQALFEHCTTKLDKMLYICIRALMIYKKVYTNNLSYIQ